MNEEKEVDKRVPIICITGTKGKTTVANAISDVLTKLGFNTLKVNTTGHFINNERRSTLDDGKENWRLVPSVCPGRYLYEFLINPKLKDKGVAVLEASLGSSNPAGLGYSWHNIGVFLNVMEDHIGSTSRLNDKNDIAKAKAFVWERILPDGYLVFNADDDYVVGSISKKYLDDVSVKFIPIGLDFSAFNIKRHLDSGGSVITVNDKRQVVVRNNSKDLVVADLVNIPWVFGGEFKPSVWNIMATVAALYAFFDGKLPSGIQSAVEALRLDPYGGRLTLLQNEKGVRILADYAHEKHSLSMVGDLAKSLVESGGKTIGIVRLAYDRTDELIIETGRMIADKYDYLIVYEKIDGYWRKPEKIVGRRFVQKVGYVSSVLFNAIHSINPRSERVLREDEALRRAAELAQPGDVVVHIVNDDVERSIGFIKEAFNAEFV